MLAAFSSTLKEAHLPLPPCFLLRFVNPTDHTRPTPEPLPGPALTPLLPAILFTAVLHKLCHADALLRLVALRGAVSSTVWAKVWQLHAAVMGLQVILNNYETETETEKRSPALPVHQWELAWPQLLPSPLQSPSLMQ